MPEYSHVCTVCSRGFCDGGSLVRHMNGHTGKRRYPCADCGVGFSERKKLLNHRCAKYKCISCDRNFVSQAELDEHTVEHTGPWECEVKCGVGPFTETIKLRDHYMNKHCTRAASGNKPWQCMLPACRSKFRAKRASEDGKATKKCAFKDKKNLLRHVGSVHAFHRPFKCESCGRTFTEGYTLKRHVEKDHGEKKSFVCCGQTFPNETIYRRHKKHYCSGGTPLVKREDADFTPRPPRRGTRVKTEPSRVKTEPVKLEEPSTLPPTTPPRRGPNARVTARLKARRDRRRQRVMTPSAPTKPLMKASLPSPPCPSNEQPSEPPTDLYADISLNFQACAACSVHGRTENELILCAKCTEGYHYRCLPDSFERPTLKTLNSWHCPSCPQVD